MIPDAPLVGPIYEETLHRAESFPVEPFNTLSNLGFLLLVVYWARWVYRAPARQRLLSWALPVLFIGFVGGTMYHGTRGWPVWLLMDWLPIALLLLAVGVYFMRKVGMGWAQVVALSASPFVASGLLRLLNVEQAYRIAIAYPLLTLPLLLPLSVYLRRTAWRDVSSVLLAVGLFAVAVGFRTIDRGLGAALLPGVGTHFLWHVLGGAASFFLVRYVYRDAQAAPAEQETTEPERDPEQSPALRSGQA